MRDLMDIILAEGFFSGDDDCWIDSTGETHDLDRSVRETHKELAKKLLAGEIPPDNDDSVKYACQKGWIRIWCEGTICFLSLDYKHVATKAVREAIQYLRKSAGVLKVWVEDSASPTYEEFNDIKQAIQYINRINVKRSLGALFD